MKEVSILFSGGPDSTLAVLHALDEADKVHLLTYHHSLMSRMGRHQAVTDELRQRFGEDRIVSHEEEIGDTYKYIYFSGSGKRLPKYRTYYVPWLCGACKLSMHCKTIAYNREHGITCTYDGASMESAPLFPAQTQEYISVIRDWYATKGMTYDAPIYTEQHTDILCAERGMTTMQNTKKEHVFFSTQHSCFVGLVIHAHARLYYKPFRGKDRMRQISAPFLSGMIGEFCSGHVPGVK